MIVFRDHDFTKRSSSVLASEPMVHVFRSSFSFQGCTLLGNGSHIPPTGFARKIHRLKSAAFQKRICFLVPWRFKHFEHLEGVTKTTPPDSFHDLSCLSAEGLSLTATAVVRGPLDSGDLGDLGFGATVPVDGSEIGKKQLILVANSGYLQGFIHVGWLFGISEASTVWSLEKIIFKTLREGGMRWWL